MYLGESVGDFFNLSKDAPILPWSILPEIL